MSAADNPDGDPAAKRAVRPPGPIALFFDFERYGATMRGEIIGGVTTFVAMSYIIALNPAILSAAGIPASAAMVTTIIAAVFGSLLMGLYANRPFAVAPYMGENAFIAYTVVRVLGYTWQTAMTAVFVSGILFLVLTAARVRPWLVEAVPAALRTAFSVGVGLFLSFVGLNEAGIVTLGVAGAPVRIGALDSPGVLIAIAGFILIALLLMYRVNGAPLIVIMLAAFACFALGIAPAPHGYAGLPPDPRPLLMQIDFHGAFSWGFFGILITVFVMAFCDTLGTLIGVAGQAGRSDRCQYDRCVHGISHRRDGGSSDRIERRDHRDPVFGVVAVCPVHRRHSGRCVQPGPDHGRIANGRFGHADQFRRPDGIDSGPVRGAVDELHLQHRDRRNLRVRAVPAVQGCDRTMAGSAAGAVVFGGTFPDVLCLLSVSVISRGAAARASPRTRPSMIFRPR